MRPVLASVAIRAVESAAFARAPTPPLIERAGTAAVAVATSMLAHEGRVLVLAGPGHNGGDAFVVARQLRARWHDVQVVFSGPDPARLPPEARAASDAWRDSGGTTLAEWPDRGTPPALVVDGLFGLGLSRPLDPRHAQLVERAHASGAPILALDVPSGLDADTGQRVGDVAIRAWRTVTFIAHKPGLLGADGPDHAGDVDVADLGLDDLVRAQCAVEQTRSRARGEPAAAGALVDADTLRAALPSRARNAHKGTHGDVRVVGGAAGMAGAALLAARAALRTGAGRVFVHRLDARAPALDPAFPELMLRDADLPTPLAPRTALVVGCGFGQSQADLARLPALFATPVPLVLDADALNAIAAQPSWVAPLAARLAPTVVTPHPAEAARLLGVATAAVQRDRLAAAAQLAGSLRATVLLKGVGTIVATADGAWTINPTGNPGLATAGTGDVLAGVIGALLAQGAPAPLAARAGAWAHGAAADRLAIARGGTVGMTASEVALAVRDVLDATLHAPAKPG
jgi:hydroxyethylthiazole kinase-like uncharacterized protein yjeF